MLLLDSFEHYTGAIPFLLTLLKAAPHCALLVTSLHPLNVRQEWVMRLNGLETPAPDVTDARLVEISFGDWQGFTFAELEERAPGSTDGRQASKWDFQPPGEGAESYQMLLERIKPWLDALRQPTVCVTHGGVIRALLHVKAGMPASEAAVLPVRQGAVYVVTPGGFKVAD